MTTLLAPLLVALPVSDLLALAPGFALLAAVGIVGLVTWRWWGKGKR